METKSLKVKLIGFIITNFFLLIIDKITNEHDFSFSN